MPSPIKALAPALLLLLSIQAQLVRAQTIDPARDGIRDPQTKRIFTFILPKKSSDLRATAVTPKNRKGGSAQVIQNFVKTNKKVLGLGSPSITLKASPPEKDEVGARQRYTQIYRGIPVYASDLSVNLNLDLDVTYVKAKLANKLPARIRPNISLAKARSLAHKLAQQQASLIELVVAQTKLLILPLGFIYNTPQSNAHLAWKIDIVDKKSGGVSYAETFFIDAKTGEDLLQVSGHQKLYREVYDCAAEDGFGDQLNGHEFDQLCHNTYPLSCGSDVDLPSPLFSPYVFGRSEGKPARGPYPNATPRTTVPTPNPLMPPPLTPTPLPTPIYYYQTSEVDKLYDYFGALNLYYLNTFGFNGRNNHGGIAKGVVPDYITRGVANADECTDNLCPGGAVFANNTTGTLVMCLGTVVPDTIGHEYSHAVVDSSGPGNFTYSGQPGALNEGSADFMGEVFELYATGTVDWKNRTTPFFDPLRDIRNPRSIVNPYYLPFQPYPDRFYSPGVYCGSQDSHGVHDNSTIVSHALYLIAQGGELNGCSIQGQGIDVAQRILYRGWSTKFSQSVSFSEAYTDLIQACNEIYPPVVCTEVTKALQAAEWNQPGKCSGQAEVSPACAVHNEGIQTATYKQHNRTSIYAPSEQIWLGGYGGVAGKNLNIYMQLHANSTIATWSSISGTPLTTTQVNPDGTSRVFVATADSVGLFDIIIDGNQDGFYQPWADTIVPIEVKVPSNNDQQCYRGDSYATSENCHDQPLDCKCPDGYTCTNTNFSIPPAFYACVPNITPGRS